MGGGLRVLSGLYPLLALLLFPSSYIYSVLPNKPQRLLLVEVNRTYV